MPYGVESHIIPLLRRISITPGSFHFTDTLLYVLAHYWAIKLVSRIGFRNEKIFEMKFPTLSFLSLFLRRAGLRGHVIPDTEGRVLPCIDRKPCIDVFDDSEYDQTIVKKPSILGRGSWGEGVNLYIASWIRHDVD